VLELVQEWASLEDALDQVDEVEEAEDTPSFQDSI
jgi:hypothetical protein